MCYQRKKKQPTLLDLFVLYKQTQLEDAMFMFKKVLSSHHKFISRGKEIPAYNAGKCCSTESVHLLLGIVLLSVV